MANTTWSPSDKTASITLSGTNLTATSALASQAVRSLDKQTTGKFYWETTVGSGVPGIGAANGTATLATMYAAPTGAAILYPTTGQIWVNNANTGVALGAFGTGTVICLAMDITGNLFWWRRGAAGNWNNNSSNNPATGVGGLSISAISSGGLFAAFCCGAAAAATANFGDSAFSGSVPSGFVAGFPGAAVAARQYVVTANVG